MAEMAEPFQKVLVRSERAELGTRSFNTVGNLVPHLVGNDNSFSNWREYESHEIVKLLSSYCRDGVDLVTLMEQTMFEMDYFPMPESTSSEPSGGSQVEQRILHLLKLEKTMLDGLSAKDHDGNYILDSLFYLLVVPIPNNQLIVRYLHSDSNPTFMEDVCIPVLAAKLGIDQDNIYLWPAYTLYDIKQARNQAKNSSSKSYYRQRIRYERRLYRDLNQIKEDYDSAGKTFIFHWRFRQSFSDKNCDASRRSNVKRNPGTYSKTYLSSLMKQDEKEWNERLNEEWFTESQCYEQDDVDPKCVEHLRLVTKAIREGHLTTLTKRQQVQCLASLSNWHWWKCLQQNGKVLTYIPHVNTFQHLSWNPSHEDPDKLTSHYATSVRNQAIYFIRQHATGSKRSAILCQLVKEALGQDGYLDNHPCVPDHSYITSADANEVPEPKPKRRRKCRPRYQPLTRQHHIESNLIDADQVLDSAEKFSTIYQRYVHALTSNSRWVVEPEESQDCRRSTIWWRYHSSTKDVFILLDTDEFSGVALPTSYVHVEIEDDENGHKSVICSCKTYMYHQVTVAGDMEEYETVRRVDVGTELTCMHVRFARKRLIGLNFDRIVNGVSSLSKFERLVSTNTLEGGYDENCVVLIGEALQHATSKFSVNNREDFAFVNLWFKGKNCLVECQEGMCKARRKKKIKLPRNKQKAKELIEKERVCDHARQVLKCSDYVTSKFPDYFTSDCNEADEEEPDDHSNNDINTADRGLETVRGGVRFNVDTEQWDHSALTREKPVLDSMDSGLRKSVIMRQRLQTDEGYIPSDCAFKGFDLIPATMDDESNILPCSCGSSLWSSVQLERKNISVYTRWGILLCDLYYVVCVSCSTKLYGGPKNHIHVWSNQTAAGQEIGWDFISSVRKLNGCSFSGFCDMMTHYYKSGVDEKASFMSKTTFIKWFFSFLAAFKLDYRQEIDPWCKHDPPILAADGTHIGVSNKLLEITPQNCVTCQDCSDKLTPLHKRFERVLIPYVKRDRNGRKVPACDIRKARKFLRWAATLAWDHTRMEDWPRQEVEADTASFKDILKRIHVPEIWKVMFIVIAKRHIDGVSEEVPRGLMQTIVRFIYMLSGDHALSAYFPFRYHDRLLQTCYSLSQGQACNIAYVRQVGIELYDLLKQVTDTPFVRHICGFIVAVIDLIKKVHQNDRDTAPITPIANSYNPSQGVAYYFTEHGRQIRRQPDYGLKSDTRTADTKNELEPDCHKIFPGMTPGGYSSCQFIFCPKHHHCYGMHIIYSGEGRKDPFSAMYKYKPTPPTDFFYDFACNLSEYCLNREPKFFCCTRFWHDIFHGINHVCGKGFKSTRVTGLEGLNTEVCEQFNSYLSAIRYTASHLSQTHFMLFAQFMMYLWGRDKTERFKLKQAVVLASMM